MIRTTLTATVSFLLLATTAFALVPPVWQEADLPAQPTRFYTVEVARFPSPILAGSVAESLQRFGWGPVLRLSDGGSVVITVGETDNVTEAHWLRRELEIQGVAEGNVLIAPVPTTGAEARGILREALLPGFLPTTTDRLLTRSEMLAELELVSRSDSEEDEDILRAFREGLETGSRELPILGNGGVAVARRLLTQRENPELALAILSPIARGEWASTDDERRTAQALVAEILHRHRQDWHAAWRASTEVANTHPSARERARARLRMAALSAELLREGVSPSPTIPGLRARLRRIAEPLAANETELQAQIELFYLQTFSWEGNWTRVEELTRHFIETHEEFPVYTAMAKTLLAQSLERIREWDEAIDLLNEVMAMDLEPVTLPRMGEEVRDPRDTARLLMRRFVSLRAGLDPLDEVPSPRS